MGGTTYRDSTQASPSGFLCLLGLIAPPLHAPFSLFPSRPSIFLLSDLLLTPVELTGDPENRLEPFGERIAHVVGLARPLRVLEATCCSCGFRCSPYASSATIPRKPHAVLARRQSSTPARPHMEAPMDVPSNTHLAAANARYSTPAARCLHHPEMSMSRIVAPSSVPSRRIPPVSRAHTWACSSRTSVQWSFSVTFFLSFRWCVWDARKRIPGVSKLTLFLMPKVLLAWSSRNQRDPYFVNLECAGVSGT